MTVAHFCLSALQFGAVFHVYRSRFLNELILLFVSPSIFFFFFLSKFGNNYLVRGVHPPIYFPYPLLPELRGHDGRLEPLPAVRG